MVITPIRGLITPVRITHEPPSRSRNAVGPKPLGYARREGGNLCGLGAVAFPARFRVWGLG